MASLRQSAGNHWRDSVLAHFSVPPFPPFPPLLLVADPDGLLLAHLEREWPGPDASMRAWLDLALAWAHALTLAEAAPLAAELHGQGRLAVAFPAWLRKSCGARQAVASLGYHVDADGLIYEPLPTAASYS
jgi:hypothetical protein